MNREPIRILTERIAELQITNETKLKVIDDEAKQEVAEAVKFAYESPFPDSPTLYDNVYCELKLQRKIEFVRQGRLS
jgi:TPP-dependent pyruvate/acetoin dehydrogenase alpha subunit